MKLQSAALLPQYYTGDTGKTYQDFAVFDRAYKVVLSRAPGFL